MRSNWVAKWSRRGGDAKSAFGSLLTRCCAEPELVSIRISYGHFSGVPLGVAGQLRGLDAPGTDLAIQRIDVVNHQVGGAADLAVAGVLRKKKRQSITSHLRKHREARLESVLPVHREPEAIHVKDSCALPAGHAQLGEYSLSHLTLR